MPVAACSLSSWPTSRSGGTCPRRWGGCRWPCCMALLYGLAEELTMRAPQLGAIHAVLGRGPALAMLSVYFGLAHVLHGMPNGAVGFLMVALVGYLFGKSMLETRGSRWAVLIHAAADVPVFLLYAVTAA